MHSAAAQVVVAAEVAMVADQRVLRKDADRMDHREAAVTGDHRPTSMMVEVVAVADRMDHRAVAALADPVTSTVTDRVISTVVGRVISTVAGRVISTVVDPVTSTVVDPAITTGVRRGIPVTTTGMGAGTEHLGATDPRRGAGVHRRLRRGSDRCPPRGDRPRRQSTTGASRSSQSGIRATTSGASTSSGSGFHFRSDPGSWP